MCVIAVCENNTFLDKDTFHKCFDANDHGAGFAWRSEGKIFFAKGFMDEKLSYKCYTRIKDYPHIAHFRLTSAGEKCRELTHPFIVSPDSEIAFSGSGDYSLLFHNGTVSDWKIISHMVSLQKKHMAKGPTSDSRVMAMLISMIGHEALSLDSGKYVIASPDGFIRLGTTFAGNDAWDEKDGIYFSNTFWDRSYYSVYSNIYGKKDNTNTYWKKEDTNKSSYYVDKEGRIARNIDQIPLELRGTVDPYYGGRYGI